MRIPPRWIPSVWDAERASRGQEEALMLLRQLGGGVDGEIAAAAQDGAVFPADNVSVRDLANVTLGLRGLGGRQQLDAGVLLRTGGVYTAIALRAHRGFLRKAHERGRASLAHIAKHLHVIK